MNHPHHPHHHPHHHHHHHHAGVAIGPLPNPCIGMVAAPTAAGPVLAGIGVPIMTAAAPALVPPPSPHSQQQLAHKNHIMSPDSSDDKDKCGGHPFIQARTSPGGVPVSVNCTVAAGGMGNQLSWSSAPTGALISAGIAYPVMGIPPGALTEPNTAATGMIYGVPISAVPRTMADHHQAAGVSTVITIPTSSGVTVSGVGGVQPPPNISMPTVIPSQNSNCSAGSIPIPQSQPQQPTKEIIHCKSCTLFPPNPNAQPPTTREKPPGCRTVFVGGLPEIITEDIVREIFERCGEITTIRMSKKNFCHIRFEVEEFVELALYLSGYRIRIGSNTDAAYIGRLHVDYAQARDDLYEWECRQRQLLREQRHRERLEQERLHPPSPPPTVHYSDHEAANVAERIKGDDTFMKAIQTLFTWLEKGECVKRNSNTFYSMIQSTNSQIRRLLNEKSQYEDDFQRAKDLMRQRMTGLLMQFTQIEKVFATACQRKVWDHFSKAQRKNIEVWRKQAAEIKNVVLEDALNERADEEMELSDLESESGQSNKENGEPRAKKLRLVEDTKTVHQLKEENDALRCQLEASKNEVDLIKADLRTELEMKDQQLRSLQQRLMDFQSSLSSPTHVVTTRSNSSDSSMSPGNPTIGLTTKQNLHSPVSVSSSSPAYGLSPTHNNNNGCAGINGSGNTNDGEIMMMMSSPLSVNKHKDIQAYCDSSSSNASLLGNLQQQSSTAQSNQHNQTITSGGSSANNDTTVHFINNGANVIVEDSSSLHLLDQNHEILTGAVANGHASFKTSCKDRSSNSNEHCHNKVRNSSSSASSNSLGDQTVGISENEARLVGIISTFLHVHPFGASLDYIWSYAQKVLPMVRPNQIEVLMTKFPTLFKQEVSGIGATFERKWIFVGFS